MEFACAAEKAAKPCSASEERKGMANMKKEKTRTMRILSKPAELRRQGLTDGRERSKLQNKQRRCGSWERRRFLFDHILFLLFPHREGPGASTPGPFLMTLRLCTADFYTGTAVPGTVRTEVSDWSPPRNAPGGGGNESPRRQVPALRFRRGTGRKNGGPASEERPSSRLPRQRCGS